MRKFAFFIQITALACLIAPLPCIGQTAGGGENALQAPDILKRLEARYGGSNFSADFSQESTLEAMDITDTAAGKAWFKHPGMMRWEYEKPERQAIVTDGKTLWIHRPADNQVLVGNPEDYFGTGKGASFLADFSLIREAFDVTLARAEQNQWRLKLVPTQSRIDLAAIYMTVERQTLDILEVTTENVYGDITRISFENLKFDPDMPGRLFDFQVPEGADVIEMAEE